MTFVCRALLVGECESHTITWRVNDTQLSKGSRVNISDEVSKTTRDRQRVTSTLFIKPIRAAYSGKIRVTFSLNFCENVIFDWQNGPTAH